MVGRNELKADYEENEDMEIKESLKKPHGIALVFGLKSANALVSKLKKLIIFLPINSIKDS